LIFLSNLEIDGKKPFLEFYYSVYDLQETPAVGYIMTEYVDKKLASKNDII